MDTVVMVFTGEYDVTHQLGLRADLESVCSQSEVVLDMTAVTYLDSTFVTELVRFRALRNDLKLEAPSIVRSSLPVKRLFSTLGLGALFRVVDLLTEVLPKKGEFFDVKYARPGNGIDPPYISIYSTDGSPAPAWDGLVAPTSITGVVSGGRRPAVGSFSATVGE